MATAINIQTEALVVDSAKSDFKMTPILLDDLRHNEILVKIKYTGICHTDLGVQQGHIPLTPFPVILGHEGAGSILAIGSAITDPALRPGVPVILSCTSCGTCEACLSNRPTFCPTHPTANFSAVRLSDGSTPAKRVLDEVPIRAQFFGQSSFSRIAVVKEDCVVPFDGTLEELLPCYAALGCGFQTGAGTVMNALRPGAKDKVVVFGLGSVGMSAVMAAKEMGAGQIVGVDVVEEKLVRAREFGATETILNEPSREDKEENVGVVSRVREITGGGADFAIDCTGVPAVIEATIDCLGHNGTAVSVGVPPPGAQIKIDPAVFFFGRKRFISVIEGQSVPREFIPRLVKLQQDGRFPIERICQVYPLEDFEGAITDLNAGKVIKPIIRWD